MTMMPWKEDESIAVDLTPLSSTTTNSPITLKFVDVSYTIRMERPSHGILQLLRRSSSSSATVDSRSKERTILSDINGMVSSGEFVAILGPSGSGKSTLLNILSGRSQLKYTGSVTANGCKVVGPTIHRIGFVTQDDILYPHLTVRETLTFCSILRLRTMLTRSEIADVAEMVMAELGLDKCSNTVVGNAFIRGISGGERRRVSIAHEMLVNPSLMLLDEPTSGLDSTAAYRLVATLLQLTRKGKGVLASVHQPSSRVFQMFDKVLLLSEGRCLYFGNGCDAIAYFSSIGFSPRFATNPADFLLDLSNGIAQVEGEEEEDPKRATMMRQDLFLSYNKLLAPKVKSMVHTIFPAEKFPNGGGKEKRGGEKMGTTKGGRRGIVSLDEISILLRRSMKERRHETFDSLRVFQVIATAVLAGAVWWQSNITNVSDRLGLLFFISIFWGVLPSFNAVFAFPQERAIVSKEHSSGMYSLSSYFAARMAGDLPMELILPLIFSIITYWMTGLLPNPSAFLLTIMVLLAYVLVAHGLGLFLGGLIMEAKKASMAATITMLAFLLTGGFYVKEMPPWLQWTKYLSCTFYCYELLIEVQYGGRMRSSMVGSHVSSTTASMALFAMFVGYRVLAYLALRRMIKV